MTGTAGTERPLTLALTKGRILRETLPLLAHAGIKPLDDLDSSRKLVFETSWPGLRLVVLRGTDVPTYVRLGAADVGVVGKDILLEQGGEGLYEPLDLGIARCRLMTAAPRGWRRGPGRLRVASKFVNVTRRHFAERGVQADIIKLVSDTGQALDGAMELAPIMNLAEMIVDIVDTGNTLRANGMEPLEEIAAVSSRLVVNKASMRAAHGPISALTDALAAAVGGAAA